MNERDGVVLKKMIQYADEIAFTIKQSALTSEEFAGSITEKNAIAMCVLQIGELVGHLTDEFKSAHSEVPWQSIKSLRNRAAHNYGEIDIVMLWNTAVAEVPELKAYCESIFAGGNK
jgi:uncharacterized protein with HEPN domain